MQEMFFSILNCVATKRKKISHTIVYDDPKYRILLHHSNRGRPERMKTSDSLKKRVAQLRKDLKFDKGSKLLLILSFSTDPMITVSSFSVISVL